MEKEICSKCGETKPLSKEYFSLNKSSKTGFRKDCKICRNKTRKQYAIKNKEDISLKRKEYYQKNREKFNEFNRKSYKKHRAARIIARKEYEENNKEKIADRKKVYYQNNKDVILERCKIYNDKNKDIIIHRSKCYYHKNKEKVLKRISQYRRNNLDKYNVIVQRRRAKEKSVISTLNTEQWVSIKEIFNNECAYCGKRKKLSQDHFIPLSKDGDYTFDNVVPACVSCNSSKGTKDFFVWYPSFEHYKKAREQKILNFLGYQDRTQQLSIL